jgi:hypothetical protein
MKPRQGNNPKRRIAPIECLGTDQRRALQKSIRYVGSGHHKRNPADYGLRRVDPRPTKSMCDLGRAVGLKEARQLIERGIERGMFSTPREDGFPKFIWGVSGLGEVFESKTDASGSGVYHGYPLENEDTMVEYVRSVWKKRCQDVGQ